MIVKSHRRRHVSKAVSRPIAALVLLAGTSQALAAGPFPPIILFSPHHDANGFVLTGVNRANFSGFSVSSAGDVNGDGIDDLIIGAPFAYPSGYHGQGEAYVVFGATNLAAGDIINLSSLNGANGFSLHGMVVRENVGFSVSSAGDVNGDGINDLIIGASGPGQNILGAGKSYVVFGAAGLGASGVIDLSTLNGANGFVLSGIDANDHSGFSVSSAGDVNGDGITDLIIGAPFASANGLFKSGESYVVFGKVGLGAGGVLDLSFLNGVNGFILSGVNEDALSGTAVSSAGDINGDGIDDLIIGAPSSVSSMFGSPFNKSMSYVVFGAANLGASGAFDLSSLSGANGFVLSTFNRGDLCGRSVSSAGDVNGDGLADLIVGAPLAESSFVVFGAMGIGASGSIDLTSLNGADGFALHIIDPRHLEKTGYSVSSAGDVNGDGIDDLIIGAPRAPSPNALAGAGMSYVVFGAAGIGAGGSFNLSSHDVTHGFVVSVSAQFAGSGYSVSSAGDVNGDGVDDIIVGARSANLYNNGRNAGNSFVVFGQRANPNPADIDANGVVGVSDLAQLVGSWGPCFMYATVVCPADLNGDFVVDAFDLAQLVGSWGP